MRMFYSSPKVQRFALMMLASDYRYTSLVLNYLEKDSNDLIYFFLGLHFQNKSLQALTSGSVRRFLMP